MEPTITISSIFVQNIVCPLSEFFHDILPEVREFFLHICLQDHVLSIFTLFNKMVHKEVIWYTSCFIYEICTRTHGLNTTLIDVVFQSVGLLF